MKRGKKRNNTLEHKSNVLTARLATFVKNLKNKNSSGKTVSQCGFKNSHLIIEGNYPIFVYCTVYTISVYQYI